MALVPNVKYKIEKGNTFLRDVIAQATLQDKLQIVGACDGRFRANDYHPLHTKLARGTSKSHPPQGVRPESWAVK